MAFSRTGWNPIGGQSKKGSAPQLWSYTSTDSIADANSEGYFNLVSDEVSVGDFIYCVTSTGSTAVATIVYVLSNASGVVDVNNGTTLANTDGD
tara:strand:- start:13205 stop:13486 length:282 start_codon:yes stop_codon:yes gene_type:complete